MDNCPPNCANCAMDVEDTDVSNCCGAPINKGEICSDCKEPCEVAEPTYPEDNYEYEPND